METTSTTSLILERINQIEGPTDAPETKETYSEDEDEYDQDVEMGRMRRNSIQKPIEKKARRALYLIGALLIGGWLLALGIYLSTDSNKPSEASIDPVATLPPKAGKKITLDQVLQGNWRPESKSVKWIDGEKDGLMLVTGSPNGFVEIRDVNDEAYSKVLMKHREIPIGGSPVPVARYWPSPDLKHLLLATNIQSVWNITSSGIYFAHC